MAPLVPRFHLWEIDDQEWFHPWLRGRVQAALTIMWTFQIPYLQTISPSRLVGKLLQKHVPDLSEWVAIDFCAGGGGPTPAIERVVNAAQKSPVRFVLTDLHPHPEDWAKAAAQSPNVAYEPLPVDASAAAQAMIDRHALVTGPDGRPRRKKVLRLFNLAFHHFDDPLARAILKNTVETSDGFAIFELQDRSLGAFAMVTLFGLAILFVAPWAAWKWRSPMTLVFTYLVPVLPFVLVFDGYVSSLRSRTPDEVEALLRTCGADGAENWVLRSGKATHMWPFGLVHWMVCLKED